jgi:hypothetical protein
VSNTQRDSPENRTPEVKAIEAPAGLDLHPKPKTSVTVSKRAGAAVGFIALGLLLAFAYGGYRRQVHAQASAHDASIPRGVLPATASASEVEKEIPSGNAPLVKDDPNRLQPPDTARQTHSTALAPANPSCGFDPRTGQSFCFNPETGQPCLPYQDRVVVRQPAYQRTERSNPNRTVTGRASDRCRVPAPAGSHDRSNRYPRWRRWLLWISRR